MIQVLAIGLAVSVVVNLIGGTLLKKAWEANAELAVTMEANEKKAEEALATQAATIATLQATRAKDQQLMMILGEANNDARAKLDQQTARLSAHRGRLAQRALASPRVAERAARIGTRRWMCDVWEASGGDRAACPSTAVPSSAARARESRTAGNPPADADSDPDDERTGTGG